MVKMKLLRMLKCWKIKSEEENLLKNQILSEINNLKQENKKALKQILLCGLQKIVDHKTHKMLELVDTKTKSKDWFVPKLTRSRENLKNI